MAKQTFTASQVLTATQMNNLQANDYNWSTNAQTANYVLVAADAGKTVTMTNAGATTITVNTSLFSAGDTVRIINLGAGTATITAGTATVNSASSLALAQYQSGTLWFTSASAAIFSPDDKTVASGMAVVKAETTFTSATSVTADNVFSSTYTNYLMIVRYSSMGASGMQIKLRASGTSASTNYNNQLLAYYGTTVSASSSLAATSFQIIDGYATEAGMAIYYLNSPAVAATTVIAGEDTKYNSGTSIWRHTGNHTTATAYDGIELIANTATGNFTIYGLAKS